MFGEGKNFTAKIRKYGIYTGKILQIKVAKYLVSGETFVDLKIHADKILHRK